MLVRILTRAVSLAGVVWLTTAGTGFAASAPTNFRPFAADSVWNMAVPANAPLSPKSQTYVRGLAQTVIAHGAWFNTRSCGMPEYWAGPHTPTVRVQLDHPSYEDPALIQAWSAVPIPSDAAPANCLDKNFAVLQQQRSGAVKEWEFWAASRASGVWLAAWGGAIDNVLTDRGEASPLQWSDPTAQTWIARRATYGWNVTASGISMIAGVVTNQELEAGHIDHALAMAVSSAAAGEWMWPAQRSDGYSSDPAALPEGAHLRLSPSLDLNALHLTPLAKMFAEAAQRYGIVVRDQTGWASVFYGEGPDPSHPGLLASLLAGQSLSSAMAAFPWAKVEVLNAPLCSSYTGCNARQKAVISVSASPWIGAPVVLNTSDSVLNYPRVTVRWDLDDSGSFTTLDGDATQIATTFTTPGRHIVSVQITCADGSVVTGSADVSVATADTSARAAAAHGRALTNVTARKGRAGTRPRAARHAARRGAERTARLAYRRSPIRR